MLSPDFGEVLVDCGQTDPIFLVLPYLEQVMFCLDSEWGYTLTTHFFTEEPPCTVTSIRVCMTLILGCNSKYKALDLAEILRKEGLLVKVSSRDRYLTDLTNEWVVL